MYLAAAGVGQLGLVDPDTVELSNLHRQILHRQDSIGWSKARSARRGLMELNPELRYVEYEESLTPANAADIMTGYDLILDCTDNPQTRYLISDIAVALHKPVVSAAAQRLDGQCMLLNYPVDVGPCYRCIFPRPPAPEMVASCEEVGVLGTAVGAMGVVMAGEAIRVLSARPAVERRPTMLLYSAWAETMFRTIRLRGKRADCLSCGVQKASVDGRPKIDRDAIRAGRVDYATFCGVSEELEILDDHERVSARQLLALIDRGGNLAGATGNAGDGANRLLVVDVRETPEYDIGPRLHGSINAPLSKMMKGGLDSTGAPRAPTPGLDLPLPENAGPVQLIFVCPRGNDSQIAARRMIDSGGLSHAKWTWIGDVRGGLQAILRERAGDEVSEL